MPNHAHNAYDVPMNAKEIHDKAHDLGTPKCPGFFCDDKLMTPVEIASTQTIKYVCPSCYGIAKISGQIDVD